MSLSSVSELFCPFGETNFEDLGPGFPESEMDTIYGVWWEENTDREWHAGGCRQTKQTNGFHKQVGYINDISEIPDPTSEPARHGHYRDDDGKTWCRTEYAEQHMALDRELLDTATPDAITGGNYRPDSWVPKKGLPEPSGWSSEQVLAHAEQATQFLITPTGKTYVNVRDSFAIGDSRWVPCDLRTQYLYGEQPVSGGTSRDLKGRKWEYDYRVGNNVIVIKYFD